MKKMFVILAAFLLALGMGSNAMAATSGNVTGDGEGKPFTVNDGDGNNLIFNFSPNVAGQYTTIAETGNEQWYSIGTYHVGGTLFYATSSDQTQVWKKDRGPTDGFDVAKIPATPPTKDDGTGTQVPIPWDEEDPDWKK